MMDSTNYTPLQSLINSDFQIVADEPNVVGWKVIRESGHEIGAVIDLLFDPISRAVRYLIIELQDETIYKDAKQVMIPIGIAHLHSAEDEVVLPNIHPDQLEALPMYSESAINPQTEAYVREVIGSPAALRLEEQTAQIDQELFYQHQHFNSASFYRKGGDPDRVAEQETIHDMIAQAKKNKVETIRTIDGAVIVRNQSNGYEPWIEGDSSPVK